MSHLFLSRILVAGLLALSLCSSVAVAQSDDEGGDGGFGFDRVTYDIGLSAGSAGGRSYTEAALGLNAFFFKYFAWRNALWGRFADQTGNVYGIDTSLRGAYSMGNRAGGFTLFGGPGFRLPSKGDSAPFAEGGLVVRLAGLSLGAGVKSILNSWVRTNGENDVQYFLILAGGGTL